MRYLPDGTQMKNADSYTIREIGIPSLVLMERAALGILSAMKEQKTDIRNPLIVCGSGNNGGDGFALARLLNEEGIPVEVLFSGNEKSLSQECRIQKNIVEKMNIPVFTEFPEGEYTVIIDAVFGVGLGREISGHYAEVIEWMNQKKGEKVAVDIPSGVCSHSGKILGIAFRADLTVAMACVKFGCELYPGKEYAGKTIAVPIGISMNVLKNDLHAACTYGEEDVEEMLPSRPANSHKGTYGKVLMITGSSGMAGASFLSACAAYAAGAGLVQIYTAENNREILQTLLPEAIISCYEKFDCGDLLERLKWADVVCIGCGLGKSDDAARMLACTTDYINNSEKTCIIDADGLNLLGKQIELVRRKKKHPVFILTPHMKEMSVLTGRTISEITESRREILDKFVSENPVVCVLKDSRTLTAAYGYRTAVNLAGNSAMAKAGSGDVLAGVITGLAAQGLSPYNSAVLGVLLHALGGDVAKKRKGSYSVTARNLIEGMTEKLASFNRF